MSLYDPEARRRQPAKRLSLALLRLAQAIKQITIDDGKAAGLTPAQAQTLLFVRHTKPFMASVGHLAASLGTTHATAVGIVDGLVSRGLLQRQPSVDDRRVSLLRLTDSGEATCRRLERWASALEQSVGQLSPDQMAALETSLGGVIWSLRQAGLLVVAEPCRGCVYFAENAAPDSPEPHRCQLIARYLSEADSRLDCPDHTPRGLDATPVPGHPSPATS